MNLWKYCIATTFAVAICLPAYANETFCGMVHERPVNNEMIGLWKIGTHPISVNKDTIIEETVGALPDKDATVKVEVKKLDDGSLVATRMSVLKQNEKCREGILQRLKDMF